MKKIIRRDTTLCALILIAASALPLSAQVFTTLASFTGPNGNNSQASLLQATNGDFYGTTVYGGTNNAGTVFKITPGGALSTIYNFCSLSGCADGSQPFSGLIQGTDGFLYGTTNYGGGPSNDGTIFKMTLTGSLVTLHSFSGGDGINPQGGLIQASNGDFYGTALFGGEGDNGTLFRINSAGAFAVIHYFNGTDGCNPYSAPMQASDGNLYGTLFKGGTGFQGAVYKMSLTGRFATLYTFTGGDGGNPLGGLIQASDGNLYGTTPSGGNYAGTVYRLTLSGTVTTLYNFCQEIDCRDGGGNIARLVQATNGLMYGVNEEGGLAGAGNIFSISTSGTYATVYNFCAVSGCPDGENPDDQGLIQATNGALYGTTPAGGASNEGTVYSLSLGLGSFVETNPIAGTVGQNLAPRAAR